MVGQTAIYPVRISIYPNPDFTHRTTHKCKTQISPNRMDTVPEEYYLALEPRIKRVDPLEVTRVRGASINQRLSGIIAGIANICSTEVKKAEAITGLRRNVGQLIIQKYETIPIDGHTAASILVMHRRVACGGCALETLRQQVRLSLALERWTGSAITISNNGYMEPKC